MTLSLSEKPTARQQLIAEARPNFPQIVLAPPGSGKTFIVVNRIRSLIEMHGLEPREILVLCFSRAASREVASRIRILIHQQDVLDDLRFVSVRTFDSFATRLLLTANPDVKLSGYNNYDSRIELLVKELADPASEASAIISSVRHLIVDEIQDLVGVRAELVRLLIERISGGFTLLGDPAQAIYGFSVQDQPDAANLDTLLAWVRKQSWIFNLTERDLPENHRSTGPVARIATELRQLLLAETGQDPDKLKAIRDTVSGLTTGSVDKSLSQGPSEVDQSICILCRTNGEVLQIASKLATLGIGFYLRPNLGDQALPAWLGRMLGEYESPRLSPKAFKDRWEMLIQHAGQPEPEQAWAWLKRIEGQSGTDLDVRKLHAELYRGSTLPDDMDAFLNSDTNQDPLSLSTIHAAKGREFDRVFILDPDTSRPERARANLEEARVLYVAATRAKNALSRLDRSGLPRTWIVNCESGQPRWVSQFANGTHLMEVGVRDDFDFLSSVNSYLFRNADDARQVQEYIWSQIHPTDQVAIFDSWTGGYLFYRVFHRPTPDAKYVKIGQMSLSFKRDLEDVLLQLNNQRKTKSPGYMYGGRVTAVVTELLPPFPKNVQEPYATTGFSLGIRFRGMLHMGWRN